jgi:hypothetical protein
MKRSELIQLVLDSVCGSYELNEDKVHEILSVLEKTNVILPPEIRNPKYIDLYPTYLHYVDDRASHEVHGSNLKFEEYYLNQWELEDV